MDIRIVETLPMSGTLADPFFKIDGSLEAVSLDWSYVNNSFDLIDRNIDYTRLPYQPDFFDASSGHVKKTFLTYNGISCQTKEVLETVVMESANAFSSDYAPGYINSNEWTYQPANFRVPQELQNGASNDLLVWPYPFNEGVTLVKTFLNSESNTVQPLYTAYYRKPTMSTFELANVDGGKVYTDGWYTSYIIVVKTYDLIQPNPNSPLSCPAGIILYNNTDRLFYVNLTGTCIAVNVNNTHLPENDIVNWQPNPTFQQWKDFLKNNYVENYGAGGQNNLNNFNGTLSPNLNSGYTATLNQSAQSAVNTGLVGSNSPANFVTQLDNVYYIESNHLATPELNAAILKELKKICGCCHENKFGMSHIEDWVKLTGKRQSAFLFFNEESFKAAQEIIVSARPKCHLSLYGNSDNCNFGYKTSC